MTGIAILCSGQGGQGRDMFDLVAVDPAAAPVFAAAAGVLGGRDPRDMAREGGDLVHRNDIAQVLCATAALATWAAVGKDAPRPLTIAGYSAGELPAWAVAGVIDTHTTFDLVARRAAFMDEETHGPAGLGAIVGLLRPAVDALCRAHQLEIAIINGPAHVILGGPLAGLREALAKAEANGAVRAAMLPIHVASHTRLLAAASERLATLLAKTVAGGSTPHGVRLLSGIDAAPVRNIGDGLAKLAAQVSTTIDWAGCMEACRAARPARVLELGPGNALARMMSEFSPDIEARSISEFRTIEGVRRWVAAAP